MVLGQFVKPGSELILSGTVGIGQGTASILVANEVHPERLESRGTVSILMCRRALGGC